MSAPRPSRRSFLRTALGAGVSAPAWAAPAQGGKTFDAIVVGAGAIGSTTAYYLAAEGLKVCLVDKGPAGREASWASAGMIQPYGSARSESWASRAALLSRTLYDRLEPGLFEETGRRIGYGGEGGLILAFDDAESARLSEVARNQTGEDFPAEFLGGAEARKREPGLPENVAGAALLPAHRFLDARTYTAVVAEAARKRGAAVREGSPVSGLLWEGKKVVGVEAGPEKIAAGVVVNAAGAWAGRVDERLALPIAPVHGQILSLQGPKGGLRHNIQRAGAGGYITPRADGRVLVGATSDDFGYEKKVTPSGLRALAAMVRELMPHLAEHRVLDTWSGLRPGSPDGLPAVGPDPRAESGYLWAAGHGGYGMMQCPATARVVADLVLKREPPIPLRSVRPARLVD
jgi:glycine oxidase